MSGEIGAGKRKAALNAAFPEQLVVGAGYAGDGVAGTLAIAAEAAPT
jgi:RecA/RadA recombinase